MQATAFDPEAPLDARRAVVRYEVGGADVEMVELPWGLRPKEAGGRPFRFVRSEGREIPSHRCLIPASEFQIKQGSLTYRCSLIDGDWFYLAGIWRPARDDWPESYAILTVEANAEVSRIQERQGALIRRGDHLAWLDTTLPAADQLRTPADGSFKIMATSARARQEGFEF